MASESDLEISKKAVAGFDWQQTPYRELAILINHIASAKKTELSNGDFSNREFACGKLLGYLEGYEDLLALPGILRAELQGVPTPNHEKARRNDRRSPRPR